MKKAGIILIVLGALCVVDIVLALVLPDGRNAQIPFVGHTWAPIFASFFIPAGAALLVAARKRKRVP